jgi:hypothetical protein
MVSSTTLAKSNLVSGTKKGFWKLSTLFLCGRVGNELAIIR